MVKKRKSKDKAKADVSIAKDTSSSAAGTSIDDTINDYLVIIEKG